jgi:hypothetical protein
MVTMNSTEPPKAGNPVYAACSLTMNSAITMNSAMQHISPKAGNPVYARAADGEHLLFFTNYRCVIACVVEAGLAMGCMLAARKPVARGVMG